MNDENCWCYLLFSCLPVYRRKYGYYSKSRLVSSFCKCIYERLHFESRNVIPGDFTPIDLEICPRWWCHNCFSSCVLFTYETIMTIFSFPVVQVLEKNQCLLCSLFDMINCLMFMENSAYFHVFASAHKFFIALVSWVKQNLLNLCRLLGREKNVS